MEPIQVEITLEMPSPVFAFWSMWFLRCIIASEHVMIYMVYCLLTKHPYVSFTLAIAVGVALHWVAFQCLLVFLDRDLAEYVMEPEVWDRYLV
jgi:hypothetical protein